MFQEWEGFEEDAGEISREMSEASTAWPYWSGWTLAEVRTAAWLVTNSDLQLERLNVLDDLETSSVSSEMNIIINAMNIIIDIKFTKIL